MKQKLLDYGFDNYSQNKEDGIIEKIFEIIGEESRVAIEFGAWDGFYLSNTANLWTKGWKGILIEMDTEKFGDLVKNVSEWDCTCINSKVGYEGESLLENILNENEVNLDEIDFLSIDIDGDDYHVFESLGKVNARVICCEFNASIPPDVELVAPRENYFGCSALSLVNLARSKGYELVSVTSSNCIFVLEKYKQKFSEYETDLDKLFPYTNLTHVISSYDGSYIFTKRPIKGFNNKAYEGELTGSYYYNPNKLKNTLNKKVEDINGELKIIIFGASSSGCLVFDELQAVIASNDNYNVKVVGFCDNDASKWGQSLKDNKILEPEEKTLNSADLIIVASLWRDEIKSQLEDMNIDSSKIILG